MPIDRYAARRPYIDEERDCAVVPLNDGSELIVDRADFPIVAPFIWTKCTRKHNAGIAYRNEPGPDGRERKVQLNRAIMGAKDGEYVSHHDDNSLNCRRSNLRLIDRERAHQRVRKRRIKGGKPTSSKYKGVFYNQQRACWTAHIVVAGHAKHIAIFRGPGAEEAAARAYDAAALKHFGADSARLNFPEDHPDLVLPAAARID